MIQLNNKLIGWDFFQFAFKFVFKRNTHTFSLSLSLSLSFYFFSFSSLSVYKLRIISEGMTRNFSLGQSRQQWRIMDIPSTRERREKEEYRIVEDAEGLSR